MCGGRLWLLPGAARCTHGPDCSPANGIKSVAQKILLLSSTNKGSTLKSPQQSGVQGTKSSAGARGVLAPFPFPHLPPQAANTTQIRIIYANKDDLEPVDLSLSLHLFEWYWPQAAQERYLSSHNSSTIFYEQG